MNLSVYRFLFTISIAIFCLHYSSVAQVSFEGQVLDKTTEAPIPFATVTLGKSRTATRTNDQGYFSLNTTSALEKDSLIFTCVGYENYRMPVSIYKQGMFIAMNPTSATLKEVVVRNSKVKTRTLGAFTSDHLNEQITPSGFFFPKEFFRMQIYAKLFKSSKPNARITSIQLGRMQPNANWTAGQPGKNARFRIHVFTVNSTNGSPDSIVFSKDIFVHDRSRRVFISLDSVNAVVSAESFFVAVEWLRIPYNEYIITANYIRHVGPNYTQTNDGFNRIIYQPLLSRYKWWPKAKSWQMNDNVWSLYEHPDFEIALSVTINY